MEPKFTLDTDAIRKRFAEAIVGIRADGTIAVLVPNCHPDSYFDLVTGTTTRHPDQFPEDFPALIRPRDRCEMLYEDGAWHAGTYCGYSSNSVYPFEVDNQMVAHIRPLPAPAPEPNPELEQARLRIENAERELSEARAALGRAQK